MGYFDRVTVSLHILYTADQETEVINFQTGEQQSRSGSDKKEEIVHRRFIKIPLG